MEIRQLYYFIAVAEELHFSRAAERLGMTQPPLSQQIQALEHSIGARLFSRTNRRVELTEAGKLFLTEARDILKRLEHASEQAARAHRGEIGELRLGFTVSAPFTTVFAKSIADFRQTHPDVQLALREMHSFEQIEALLERRLHIGMVRPVALPESLASIELMREPMVIVLRSDHPAAKGAPAQPVPLATFANDDFIAFPRSTGGSFIELTDKLCQRAGFKPRVLQEAREASTQIALVAAGFGVAIMPALQQRIQVDNVVYRPIADQEAHTAVWLVWRSGESSPLVRAFVERVRREIPLSG